MRRLAERKQVQEAPWRFCKRLGASPDGKAWRKARGERQAPTKRGTAPSRSWTECADGGLACSGPYPGAHLHMASLGGGGSGTSNPPLNVCESPAIPILNSYCNPSGCLAGLCAKQPSKLKLSFLDLVVSQRDGQMARRPDGQMTRHSDGQATRLCVDSNIVKRPCPRYLSSSGLRRRRLRRLQACKACTRRRLTANFCLEMLDIWTKGLVDPLNQNRHLKSLRAVNTLRFFSQWLRQ